MDEETFAALDDVAGEVARRYAARTGWRVDEDDLKQEAWMVSMEIVQSYGKDVATLDGIRALCWTASMRRLSRYLWQNSAPVSETNEMLKTLRGVHAVPLDRRVKGGTVAELLEEPAPSQEAQVALHKAQALVRRRVRELNATKWPDGSIDVDDWVEASMRVLLDGEKPAAVARDMMLPVSGVYSATEWTKKRAVRDRIIKEACEVIRGGS